MREVGAEIAGLDAVVAEADSWLAEALVTIPNLPDDSVPRGGVEANRIVRQWGIPSGVSLRAAAPTGSWENRSGFWISPPERRCRGRDSRCCVDGAPRFSGG